jgi:hypothetical protein
MAEGANIVATTAKTIGEVNLVILRVISWQ